MNVHAAIGILISMLFSTYLSEFQIYLIIGFSIIIDLDFLLSRFAQNKNHRRLITHTLIPYIIITIVGIIFLNITSLWIYIFLFGICGLIHVSIDSIDWGIMLYYPFKQDLKGGILVRPNSSTEIKKRDRRCYFFLIYYSSKIIIFLELVFGLLAFLSIIIIHPDFYYLFFIYIGTLIVHIIQYIRCKKYKNKYQ